MLKKLFNLGAEEAPEGMAAAAPRFPTAEEVMGLEQQVDTLAGELPPEKGVLWAAKSADMVKAFTSPQDLAAAQAAEAFAREPNADLQKAAVEAAVEAAEVAGPGSMAAQAAGMAMGPSLPMGAANVMGDVALAGLVDQLKKGVSSIVAGAVKLAAALLADSSKVAQAIIPLPKIDLQAPTAPELPEIPEKPEMMMSAPDAFRQMNGEQLARSAEVLKPFLELGEKIKSGLIS